MGDTEAWVGRMRRGMTRRRGGWARAGRESQPATAARSGGKSNKIRAMRRRRRRMVATQRYENWVTGVRAIVESVPSRLIGRSGTVGLGMAESKGVPPPRVVFGKECGID